MTQELKDRLDNIDKRLKALIFYAYIILLALGFIAGNLLTR